MFMHMFSSHTKTDCFCGNKPFPVRVVTAGFRVNLGRLGRLCAGIIYLAPAQPCIVYYHSIITVVWRCRRQCEVSLHIKHHIQGNNFATRHVRAHFKVSLHVTTWALINRDIDINKCHENSPSNVLVNKNERKLWNHISAHGKGTTSSHFYLCLCFRLTLRCSCNSITWTCWLHVINRDVAWNLPRTLPQHTHFYDVTFASPVFFPPTCSRFTSRETSQWGRSFVLPLVGGFVTASGVVSI